METNTLDEKSLHYIDSYCFEKKIIPDSAQWIADQVKNGLEIGQWLDGFRIHGKNKRSLSEIETLWEAISFFSQGDLDALVIGENVYFIPEDAREIFNFFKNGKNVSPLQDNTKLSPFALNLYGKYLTTLDKVSDATAFFSEALKKESRFSEPYNNLGQLMWKIGKQRDAFLLFTESLAKNPHLLPAQLNFFDAGLELEEYASMLNVIKYLEEEIPECSEFQYYKAICNHRLGNHEEARSILNLILKDKPNDAEAKQLLQNYA